MSDEPNVDDVRRLVNVSPEDMSDDDIRRALAALAAEYDARNRHWRRGGSANMAPPRYVDDQRHDRQD